MASKKKQTEQEQAPIEYVATARGSDMRDMEIGSAFQLDNGDVIVMLQAMPFSGNLRLVRRVTP